MTVERFDPTDRLRRHCQVKQRSFVLAAFFSNYYIRTGQEIDQVSRNSHRTAAWTAATVNQAAATMNQIQNLDHVLFEQTQGIGVGEHKAGYGIIAQFFERGQVDVPA